MSTDKTKLVCLADSVGTNYKMKVRTNTFSDLLGRRLGLETHNYATPGATTGYLLGYLKENDEIIENVKQSKVIVIACGTNNVLSKGLVIMGKAGGFDVTSWRLLPKIVEAIRVNPVRSLKMVSALNSHEAIEDIMEGVRVYEQDMPVLIDKIHELNPEAIILATTVYTMSDISKSVVYKVTTKSQSMIADSLNNWMKNNLPQMGVEVVDIAHALKEYHGHEELSNLNEDDIHLSDAGHLFAYRLMYDEIVKNHPDMAREEGPDVIQERKLKKKNESESADDGIHAQVKQLFEKTLNREDFVYDENKQLLQMGISLMEILDISRAIEKQYFDGKEVLDMPVYNLQTCIKPQYYIDYIEGKQKRSILEHLDDLEHYASIEEKKEAEKNDSAGMKMLRKHIYDYLKDDMVKIDENYTFFKQLDMNYIDWADVLFSIETKLNLSLDRARTPDPENVTLKQVANDIEKAL